jgi:phosphatidylglycerophosphate synthase
VDVTAPAAFRILTEEAGPWFLGLRVAERNRRVAERYGGTGQSGDSPPAMLKVPAGVAITPALLEALPQPAGVWHLVWERADLPLVWHGPTGGAQASPQSFQLPSGAALDVSTAAARRRASWRLLRESGKPADGWLSRHIHRRVSRVFSYLLLTAGLSAHSATVATFGVGVASAWLMAQTSHGTMIAAALLFWCASIADGIDGEMARLTLSESRLGEQLDTGVDQLTYLFGLVGMMIGWMRQGMNATGIVVGASVVLGTPTVLFWGMGLVRRARRTTQFFVPTKPIEGAVFSAARRTRAPVLRLAAVVFVLFRREAFSLAFFIVSFLTGLRAVYPLLVAGGLGIVTLTFLLHHEALVEELARESA